MLTLPFRNLVTRAAKKLHANSIFAATYAARATAAKKGPLTENQKQQEAALNDLLFLVDEKDNVKGQATKRECHRVTPGNKIPLHRGFSVFYFNKHGDLLLQKRASDKVFYPNLYTNSCVGHQTVGIEGEDDTKNGMGAKRAARRRMSQELGIPIEKIALEQFTYLTRIHYMDEGNGTWGEHEITTILFIQADFPLNPNPNDVSEISIIPRAEFDEHFPTLGTFTPWFRLILSNRLKLWWDNLEYLHQFKDHENILELGIKK